jgi:hypothetical protein
MDHADARRLFAEAALKVLLLRSHLGVATQVDLARGSLQVKDIVYGRATGADFDEIIASPDPDDATQAGVFRTSDIVSLRCPADGGFLRASAL